MSDEDRRPGDLRLLREAAEGGPRRRLIYDDGPLDELSRGVERACRRMTEVNRQFLVGLGLRLRAERLEREGRLPVRAGVAAVVDAARRERAARGRRREAHTTAEAETAIAEHETAVAALDEALDAWDAAESQLAKAQVEPG